MVRKTNRQVEWGRVHIATTSTCKLYKQAHIELEGDRQGAVLDDKGEGDGGTGQQGCDMSFMVQTLPSVNGLFRFLGVESNVPRRILATE